MVNGMGEVQVESPTVPPRAFRVVGMAAYAVALACWIAVMGLPRQALPAVAWIWLATIAWNIRSPARAHLDFPRDWSLPLLVLTGYLYSRGLADDLGFVSVHVTAPIQVDRWMFGGTLPTEWLQERLCGSPCDRTSPPHWYDVVLTTVYYSHFVVALTIAGVLWVRDRGSWVRYMRRYLSLNILALVVYVTYPMAPPWLAVHDGQLRRTWPGSPAAAGTSSEPGPGTRRCPRSATRLPRCPHCMPASPCSSPCTASPGCAVAGAGCCCSIR